MELDGAGIHLGHADHDGAAPEVQGDFIALGDRAIANQELFLPGHDSVDLDATDDVGKGSGLNGDDAAGGGGRGRFDNRLGVWVLKLTEGVGNAPAD